MTNKLIGIVMALCFGAVAQVNLTGTVTDGAGGSPLPGVSVALKTLGISDTTDAQGKYQIIATGSKWEGRSSAKIIPGGRVVGNLMRLDILEHSPVTVELFDATGVKITTLFKNGNLAGGTYDINLSASRVAAGLYLIRVRQGNQTWIHRYLPTQTALQRNLTNNAIGASSKGMAKRSDAGAAIDTLVFSKSGYGTIKIPIQSYTGVIDTVLLVITTVTDIDGNVYHMVTIGTQVWMVENLKTTRFSDSAAIPSVTDNNAWGALTTPGYCWFGNDSVNNFNFGALYNWYAVNTGKLAPKGWHVPTDTEWTMLTTYLGGESVAGGKLKVAGLLYWPSPNTGATNETGFSALPGCFRNNSGVSDCLDPNGYWWSSSAYDTAGSWFRYMFYNSANVGRDYNFKKDGFSVRCLRD
jgi:uncharacterized protein (TIGR02145 family)